MSLKDTEREWIQQDKIFANCAPRGCKFSPQHYPAKSFELNAAENAENVLKVDSIWSITFEYCEFG